MTSLNRRDFAAIGISTLLVGKGPTGARSIGSGDRGDIVIRPFASKDAEAVGRLVDAEYLNDVDRVSSLYAINRGLHLPSGRGGDWSTTLVAEKGGAVVGVGSSSALSLSRHARTHVIAAPSQRRRGIGTRLYREVSSLVRARERLPIASIAAREGVAFRFASSCGMRPLMRSRQLTVDLTFWAVEVWARNALEQPSPYRLVAASQVAPEVFFGAVGAAYHYMHERWSDVQSGTPEQYRAIWSGRVTDTSGVVALEGNRAVGVGNFFANGGEEGGVVVFPTGVCSQLPSLDHERALTARLLELEDGLAIPFPARREKAITVGRGQPAAERLADEGDVPRVESREGRAESSDQRLGVVGTVGNVGRREPGHVQRDDPVPDGEMVDHPTPFQPRRAAEPVDEHEGRAGSSLVVVDPPAVDRDELVRRKVPGRPRRRCLLRSADAGMPAGADAREQNEQADSSHGCTIEGRGAIGQPMIGDSSLSTA